MTGALESPPGTFTNIGSPLYRGLNWEFLRTAGAFQTPVVYICIYAYTYTYICIWAVASILVPGTDLDSVFPACRLVW